MDVTAILGAKGGSGAFPIYQKDTWLASSKKEGFLPNQEAIGCSDFIQIKEKKLLNQTLF